VNPNNLPDGCHWTNYNTIYDAKKLRQIHVPEASDYQSRPLMSDRAAYILIAGQILFYAVAFFLR